MALVFTTKAITINGDTRDVEFMFIRDDYIRSRQCVGLYSKGAGRKTWRDSLVMFKQQDGSWKLSHTTTILNRGGYRLIGWHDGQANSRHSGA